MRCQLLDTSKPHLTSRKLLELQHFYEPFDELLGHNCITDAAKREESLSVFKL